MITTEYISLIFYIFISITVSICVRKAMRIRPIYAGNKYITQTKNAHKNSYFFLLLFILILLAILRKVTISERVGVDSWNYANDFKLANFNDYYKKNEYLFAWYASFIRIFTDNYAVFFACTYSIIIIGYCVFIRTYCPGYICFAPFVCLLFPYLHSFNTMRTSLAIAIFLIGLSIFKKHKITGSIIVASTFFIHRISILYVPVVFFYWLFKKAIRKMHKTSMLIFCVSFLIGAIFAAQKLQLFVIQAGILEKTDNWYLSQSIGVSLISRFPMYFAHILLLIAFLIFDSKVKKTEEYELLRIFCIYDILVIVPSVVLGFWRANEYLYVARLIMWGQLISSSMEKQRREMKILVILLAYILFLAWFVFRVYSTYDDAGLLPYYFLWN